MSLIMYYRNYFTADCSVSEYEIDCPSVFEQVTKTYFSKDKRMAGISCGSILQEHQWEKLRSIFNEYNVEDLKPTRKAITELYKNTNSENSTVYFVMGDLFICIKFTKPDVVAIANLDRSIPYVDGTGKSAANVLIEYNKSEISFSEFFRIVALSAPGVSSEFTQIDLTKVIGTPWYKKPVKPIKPSKNRRKK